MKVAYIIANRYKDVPLSLRFLFASHNALDIAIDIIIVLCLLLGAAVCFYYVYCLLREVAKLIRTFLRRRDP